MPDRETVRIGRRYTSGKECVPMCITTGSLLQRIEKDRDTEERFCFFMPTAQGPCRFGVYNLLHKITLERLEWKDRVRVWSPVDKDYFEGIPAGFTALLMAGFVAADMLLEALYDVRPVETTAGAANALHERYSAELWQLMEQQRDLSVPAVLYQVTSGKLFGCADLLQRAATDLAAIKGSEKKPSVLVVGEIYVRCDPFANDFVIDKLERRGVRCRFAPFTEWLEYTDLIGYMEREKSDVGDRLRTLIQTRTQDASYNIMAKQLGWPKRTTVKESLDAAEPYVRRELTGEAVITVGGPVHEWRHGHIDGVVSVGPLECMPNKISEAQFFHVAEKEGLPSLTLALNGDPVDPEVVDNFTFDVHTRYRERASMPQTGQAASQAWLETARRKVEQFVRQLSPKRQPAPTRQPAMVVEDLEGLIPQGRAAGSNGHGTQAPAPEAVHPRPSKPEIEL